MTVGVEGDDGRGATQGDGHSCKRPLSNFLQRAPFVKRGRGTNKKKLEQGILRTRSYGTCQFGQRRRLAGKLGKAGETPTTRLINASGGVAKEILFSNHVSYEFGADGLLPAKSRERMRGKVEVRSLKKVVIN